jgi:multicomponent Na+:H+ antiporter subunit G
MSSALLILAAGRAGPHPVPASGLSSLLPEVLIVAGAVVCLVGCIGLLRLPDAFTRLQAVGKCLTAGSCLILLGVALQTGWSGLPDGVGTAIKAGLCAVFLLVAGPVAVHAIARGAHRAGVRQWGGAVGDEYLQDRSGESE